MLVLLSSALTLGSPAPATAATIAGATTVSTVSPSQATIGEAVQYTLSVTLPGGQTYYNAAILDTVSLGMTPVGSATVTCVSVARDCSSELPGSSSGYALPSSGQRIGWLLGTVGARPEARVITVVFSARIDDVARNAIAGNPTNTAFVTWNDSAVAPPATAASTTFTHNGPSSSILVRVKEPALSIVATVSDATPGPGEAVAFVATVSNANATYTSSAFGVRVVATISPGVIVEGSSITAGGVLDGSTITWSLASSLAKNAAVALKWNATLAGSSSLTGGALTSTVRISHYQSLASGGRNYPSGPTSSDLVVVPDFPALTVTKAAATQEPAYRGTAFPWTIRVVNSGRSLATDLTVRDLLPANWAFEAGSATLSVNGGSPAPLGNPSSVSDPETHRLSLMWGGLGSLAVDASIDIRYAAVPLAGALIDPGVGASVDHLNSVTATARDATGSPGTAIANFSGTSSATAHINSADLAVSFSASEPTAGTANDAAWTIVVTNLGPDAAVGPFIVEDSPEANDGRHVVGASGPGWSCGTPDPASGRASCTRADANESLAPGSSFPPIAFAASLDADVPSGAVLRDTIGVSGRTWDPDLTNNVFTAEGEVVTSADLSLSTSMSGTVAAGQVATWTIDLVNIGPSVSRGPITVVDTFPDTVADVDFAGTGWTCELATGTATCTYAGDLAVTSAPRITATARIDPGYVGEFRTVATIITSRADPNSSNDTAASTSVVDSDTTLLLEKGLVGSTLVPGGVAHYSFAVENSGLASARSVVIADSLPSGLVFAGLVAASPGSWQCAETSTSPSAVRCLLDGTLAPGTVETVTVAVAVPPSLVGAVRNSATATADNAPSATDIDDSALAFESDLGISRSHGPGPIYAGTSADSTVVVHNYGPSDEPPGITVVDQTASGLRPVSAEGIGWNCDPPSGQQLTCTSLVTLPAGQSLPILTVTVMTPADAGPAEFVNVSRVKGTYDEPIPDAHSNAAQDIMAVTAFATVSVDRQIESGELTVVAGSTIDYSIVISNTGPSVADAVVVAGFLPAGFTAVAYSGPGWNCALETLVCSRAELGVGTVVITVTVATSSDIPDGTVVLNTARVDSTDGRPQPSSDTASVRVTVRAIADLVLLKTTPDATPDAGSDVSWQFTLRNAGISDAVGAITIADALPPSVRFRSGASGWDCRADVVDPASPQAVTCTQDAAGLVAGGTALDLTILTTTAATTGFATLVNTATVSALTLDANLADNTATASITFGTSADLSITVRAPAHALIGGTASLSLIVTNVGPSAATAVTVVGVLPPGLHYTGVAATSPGWLCESAAEPASGSDVVTCTLSGPLQPGSAGSELTLRASLSAQAYPSVTTELSVTSETGDPDESDNSVTTAISIAPLVQLGVTKTHPGQLSVGSTVTYQIDVSNSGPTEDPGGFWIVDTLPTGLVYLGASGQDVDCTTADARVTCSFAGPLPPGDIRSVFISARVLPSAGTVVVNTVEALSRYTQVSDERVVANDSARLMPALPFTGGILAPGLVVMAALTIGFGAVLLNRRRRSPTSAFTPTAQRWWDRKR